MIPILPPARAQNVQEHHIQDFTGGLNQGTTPEMVRDNQATFFKNVDTNAYPALQTRKGQTAVGASAGASGIVAPFLKSTGFYGLYRVAGGKFQRLVGTDWTDIATGLSTLPMDAVTFPGLDLLIMSNGVDNPKKYDGTTFADLAGSPPKMRYMAVHKNRVFGTGVPGYPVRLYYSALSNPNDWTTVNDSGSIDFETADGTENTGLVSYDNILLLFKPGSTFALLGSGPSDFTKSTVSSTIGCSSHRSIVQIGNYLYWLGRDGIYQYIRGSTPRRISEGLIDNIIDNIDYNETQKIAGATDGTRYYISLPLIGGGKTLVFDPRFGSWFTREGLLFSAAVSWKRPA